MKPLLITHGYVIDPSQGIEGKRDLLIIGGKVAWVGEGVPPQPPSAVIHAQGLILCPGFIDLHCHLREPGYEEKETIHTGTEAAAAGGFTTICCMPDTNPPIDDPASIAYISKKASTEGVIRLLPIACLTKGRKGQELVDMVELSQAGAIAFSDDGYPIMSPILLRRALEYSLAVDRPIFDHCQDMELSEGGVVNEGWVSLRLGLKGIPPTAEQVAIARDIALARLTGAKVHLLHLSTADSVELVKKAKEKGIPVTAEVTPHHLTLTEERVIGFNTNAKVNPPLRTLKDTQALIQGLKEGIIDAIATDHAPHNEVDKMTEFDQAAFGISGLETALANLLGLVYRGDLDMVTLISKLTCEPAKIIGKEANLKEGSIADITIFDPQREWMVEPERFFSKGKNTPLAGEWLRGKVVATLVGGELVYQDAKLKMEVKEIDH